MPPHSQRHVLIPLALLLLCTGSTTLPSCGGQGSGDTPTQAVPARETPPASSDSPLADLLTSPALQPYWHASLPGRVPVRIVANPNSTDRPVFQLLGAPVQWITSDQAVPGQAFLVVDFQLVDGLLNLSVRYPIEGVRASAVYVPAGSGWARTGPVRVTEE